VCFPADLAGPCSIESAPKTLPESGPTHILIVDDEEQIQRVLVKLLERQGYQCSVAGTAEQAHELVRAREFAVLLCDVNLPGQSGIDFLQYIVAEHPNTATVMVTGLDDTALAQTALDIGAYGYIIKPFEMNEMIINVTNALRRRKLEMENRAHRNMLERMVHARTLALRKSVQRLQQTEHELRLSREETIFRLARAAEFRDGITGQHIHRMSRYCELIARRLGFDPERCELIRMASILHDIGKLGTPDHILLKPAALTAAEYEIMKKHAETGYEMLAGSESRLLQLAATIARTHHEKYDGRGYPHGLRGNDIPIEGRIAAVADVFDALTSVRPYKAAEPVPKAVEMLRAGHGSHFDPVVLDEFLAGIDEALEIKRRYADREALRVRACA
jgi:putative two-component system response regulator